MRRLGLYLRLTVVLSCVLPVLSYAQSASTATIVGRVVDPQDAVIPDAKVTVINTATGVSRSVNTTSSGDYTIPNLSPGTYDIKVQASGFAVGQAKGIKVNVGTAGLEFQAGPCGNILNCCGNRGSASH